MNYCIMYVICLSRLSTSNNSPEEIPQKGALLDVNTKPVSKR